jgi:hypothetical protein
VHVSPPGAVDLVLIEERWNAPLVKRMCRDWVARLQFSQSRKRSIPLLVALDPLTHVVWETRTAQWLTTLVASHQSPCGAQWELDQSGTDGPVY